MDADDLFYRQPRDRGDIGKIGSKHWIIANRDFNLIRRWNRVGPFAVEQVPNEGFDVAQGGAKRVECNEERAVGRMNVDDKGGTPLQEALRECTDLLMMLLGDLSPE